MTSSSGWKDSELFSSWVTTLCPSWLTWHCGWKRKWRKDEWVAHFTIRPLELFSLHYLLQLSLFLKIRVWLCRCCCYWLLWIVSFSGNVCWDAAWNHFMTDFLNGRLKNVKFLHFFLFLPFSPLFPLLFLPLSHSPTVLSSLIIYWAPTTFQN